MTDWFWLAAYKGFSDSSHDSLWAAEEIEESFPEVSNKPVYGKVNRCVDNLK